MSEKRCSVTEGASRKGRSRVDSGKASEYRDVGLYREAYEAV